MAKQIRQVTIDALIVQNKWVPVPIVQNSILRKVKGIGSHLHLWYEGDTTQPLIVVQIYCAVENTDLPADLGAFLGSATLWGGQKVLFLYAAKE